MLLGPEARGRMIVLSNSVCHELEIPMKLYFASLSLLCLALAVIPASAQTLYDNGPVNGGVNAWTINFGYVVSDTFTL